MRRAMLLILAAVVAMVLGVAGEAAAVNGALSWQAAPNATGYEVHGCTGAAPACGPSDPAWSKLTPTPIAGLSYTETNLPLNTRLCRRVAPVNAFGAAAPTSPICQSADLPGPISGQLIWSLTPQPGQAQPQ